MINLKDTSKNFEFVSVSSITQNLKPTQWLIKGYFEQHTMALMFGDPACGKSFVAIDLACCIATGTPWHGNKVTQGAVFYIAGEGHNGFGRRFRAWEEHSGILLNDAPLYIAKCAAQIYDADSAEAVASAIQKLVDETGQVPRLIIIDTMARNFGGGDENSTKDTGIFIRNLDALKDCWDASTLIIHHTGHSDKNRGRGAMAIKGALDHEYRVQKDDCDVVNIEATKTKDSKDPDGISFELTSVDLPFTDDEGQAIKGAVLVQTTTMIKKKGKKLSPQKKRAVDILLNCLIDKGEKRLVIKDMQPVKCVKIDEYKEYLRLANIVTSDDADNIRRRISAIITELSNHRITGTYGDFIWIPDQTD